MIDENALLGFARRARFRSPRRRSPRRRSPRLRSESTVSRPQRGQINLAVKIKHLHDPSGVKCSPSKVQLSEHGVTLLGVTLLGVDRRARYLDPQWGQITLDVKVNHTIYGDPSEIR